jgi:hypothetical protein
MHPMIYIQICQISKSPEVIRTSHFPLGTQTFLMLFMVDIISFITQMHLTPFPLLACLLALMYITFSFFFFLIKYGVPPFIYLVDVGFGDLACCLFLLFSPGLCLALVRLMSFLMT